MIKLDQLPGYTKGEHVIMFLRRHWFVFVSTALIYVVLLFLPPIFYYLVISSQHVELSNILKAVTLLLLSSYYLFVWLFLFNAVLDHYLDVWLITNHRIVNIEQKGLFSRTVSEQKIEKIQDITSEVVGFIPTFLDYGTVYVQTAGSKERFIFKDIPNPAQVVADLTRIVEKNNTKT